MIGGDSGNVLAMRPLRARRDDRVRHHPADDRGGRPARLGLEVPAAAGPRLRVLAQLGGGAPGDRGGGEVRGRKSVTLVEEPLAAAIGAGLPIHEPVGNLIVDIGGGTSEMAVVSMGGVVSGRSVRLGGFDLDVAIQDHIRATYQVAVGEKSAEEIKIAIGSAFPAASGHAALVRGRALSTGNTVEVKVGEDEVRQAMSPAIRGSWRRRGARSRRPRRS